MTSQPARDDSALIVKRINNRMRAQCAFLGEARIFDYVNYANFLRAFEYGLVDCGLFLGDELPEGTHTDVMFRLQDLYGDEDLIFVGIDVKTSVYPVALTGGGLDYRIRMSNNEQYHAAEAIIVNGLWEPDFVALVPMWYIRLRVAKIRSLNRVGWGGFDESMVYFLDSHRHMWTLHQMPGIAPELRPFIHPIKQLGRALEIMRDYAKGERSEW